MQEQPPKKKKASFLREWWDNFGVNDYSNHYTFNEAFRQARIDGEKEFVWRGKKYTSNLVSKDLDKNYKDSKEFLDKLISTSKLSLSREDSIKSNRNPIVMDALVNEYRGKLKRNLNQPIYTSITEQKDKQTDDDGYFEYSRLDPRLDKKLYIGSGSTTPVHELAHKAGFKVQTNDEKHLENILIKRYKEKNLDLRGDFVDGNTFGYISDPTERAARHISTKKFLSDKGLNADNIGEKEYNYLDSLRQEYKKEFDKQYWNDKNNQFNTKQSIKEATTKVGLPYDVAQLFELYDGKDEFIKQLNTPLGINEAQSYKYGGMWKNKKLKKYAWGDYYNTPSSSNAYQDDLQKSKGETDALIGGIGAINPIVGAFMKVGQGIGAQTVDDDGIYKSRVSGFIDSNVNPTTGIQNLKDFSKDITWDTALSQFSAGIFGESASQKRAKEAKQMKQRELVSNIEDRSQETLRNYPAYGVAAYGKKLYPNGGRLPYPTDGSKFNTLSSDMIQYHGDNHENGGIKLDTNQDNKADIEVEDKEVIKDNMVFSDRLNPSPESLDLVRRLGITSKQNDTYASITGRIGKLKGKYESKLDSTRNIEKRTGELMINRFDNASNLLFEDQQEQNRHLSQDNTSMVNPKIDYLKTLKPFEDTYDKISGSYHMSNAFRKYDRGGPFVTDMGEEPIPDDFTTPQLRKFNIGDYKGDIAAGIGSIVNQALISKLETNYQPDLIEAPRNSYTNRLPYLTKTIDAQFQGASRGISGSSAQDNNALKANLYAKTLSSLNQAVDSETQRKDNIDNRYNELVNRTNLFNTQIKNRTKELGLENRNQRLALTQANIDNAIRSYMGNESMREAKELDFIKSYLNFAKEGDTGVANRLIKQLPERAKRRIGFGNY